MSKKFRPNHRVVLHKTYPEKTAHNTKDSRLSGLFPA